MMQTLMQVFAQLQHKCENDVNDKKWNDPLNIFRTNQQLGIHSSKKNTKQNIVWYGAIFINIQI